MFKALMNLLLALTIANAAVGCATVEAPAPTMVRGSDPNTKSITYTKLDGPLVWNGTFPQSVLSSFIDQYKALLESFNEAVTARSSLEREVQLGCKSAKAQTIINKQLYNFEQALANCLRTLNTLQDTEKNVLLFPALEDINRQIATLNSPERVTLLNTNQITLQDFQAPYFQALDTKKSCVAALEAREKAAREFKWWADQTERMETDLANALAMYKSLSCEQTK